MLLQEIKIKMPFLWGKQVFHKTRWNQINLIVGPNGSGKTLLAEELAKNFDKTGYPAKFIKSERSDYSDILTILKENQNVRLKIETILTNMFSKSIRFFTLPDGNVIPIVVNKERNVEYNLQGDECHGLREILNLLVTLFSSTEKCIIFDEPELHLHPQLQVFFMNEIRKVAETDRTRTFFLITHSPFFIDLHYPDDLIGVIVCHVNRCPTHIEKLNSSDQQLISKFLPRFNTYHKQFFFSDNQIFVEGYTDRQMFSILLNKLGSIPGSAGTGIIDVGGKDELGVFFRICSLLGTSARIITDLDGLFRGKLRDEVCKDFRVRQWLLKHQEKQLPFYQSIFTKTELENPVTMNALTNKLDAMLIQIGKAISTMYKHVPSEVDAYKTKVLALDKKYENVEDLDTYKTVILQGIYLLGDKLGSVLPLPLAAKLPLIKNLASLIFAAAESCRVYILNKGCIEHYYRMSKNQYMPLSGKDKLFQMEYNHIMAINKTKLKKEYSDLINILIKACSLNN